MLSLAVDRLHGSARQAVVSLPNRAGESLFLFYFLALRQLLALCHFVHLFPKIGLPAGP